MIKHIIFNNLTSEIFRDSKCNISNIVKMILLIDEFKSFKYKKYFNKKIQILNSLY